ncbi:MAG: pyridoxal-phosphate dependent enzyme [Anaerolineae bacterium]
MAVLHKGVSQGFRQAWAMVWGAALVDAAYILLSVAGVSALLQASSVHTIVGLTGTLVLINFGLRYLWTPAELGIRGSREKARELAESLPNAIYIEQHHNPANAQSHFETTAEEIWRDTEGQVDIFAHGLGSCGTITGVARALKERRPSMRFVGFEPEGADLMAGGEFNPHRLLGIGPGFVPGLFDRDLIDELVTVRVEDAFATCREIAAREGLLVGISSGASAWLALDLARRPENAGKTIVIIFSDAGQGYLSVDGLFDRVGDAA